MGASAGLPVILFDIMGTVVSDPFFRVVPSFFGLTLDELLQQKASGAWPAFEEGRLSEEELATRYFRDGRPVDVAGLKRSMAGAYQWLPGMEALLVALRARGAELHAFSNYPPWYRLIEERLALSRYLSWSFVSCELGARKPAPLAFERVLARLGRPAGQCLLIDDSPENCRAAVDAGMPAVLFESAAKLRSDLEDRLLTSLPS